MSSCVTWPTSRQSEPVRTAVAAVSHSRWQMITVTLAGSKPKLRVARVRGSVKETAKEFPRLLRWLGAARPGRAQSNCLRDDGHQSERVPPMAGCDDVLGVMSREVVPPGIGEPA